jgi:hypothetical protein
MAEVDRPSADAQLLAVLALPGLYELADTLPRPNPNRGGRPRQNPAFVYLLFAASVSVFRSARRAEVELAARWRRLRKQTKRNHPADSSKWLPKKPMTRGQYEYLKLRYMRDASNVRALVDEFEASACRLALALGLCTPDRQSPSHPDLDNVVYGDGKVIKPLTSAKGGSGHERAARLHGVGGGSGTAYGTKVLMVATRGRDDYSRVIVGLDTCGKDEMGSAVAVLDRTLPRLPGTDAVVYDGASRGEHQARLIRRHGVIPVTPPRANTPDQFLGKLEVRRPDGRVELLPFATRNTSPKLVMYGEAGEPVFIDLTRIKTERRGRPGQYRLSGQWGLPKECGGGIVRIPHYQTDADDQSGFNRCEHLRPIPSGDPDYGRLYGRRSDIESINRHLEDSLWLERAHSVGEPAQLFDLVGFGLMVNAYSLAVAVKRGKAPPAVAAA